VNILIINLGPHGDVLRTTILLNQFQHDNIYWLTSVRNKDILNSPLIKKVFFVESISIDFEYHLIKYDIVISLNEEHPFKNEVQYNKIIGVKKDRSYTIDSAYWFNMSLISVFGEEEANRLKKKNRKSYNQILIEMVGGTWNEQEYQIDYKPIESNKIGLIKSVNGIWRSKKWNGFDELYERLSKDFEVSFLDLKPTVKEHIEDINNCRLIVCPDTLGMHIAIALKKKVVALFNCTSPYEIYDYGRVTKIVSPLYEEQFYTKECSEELFNSISVDEVYNGVITSLK
jgi:heptosyltransferase-2